jgi:hypothetical protein
MDAEEERISGATIKTDTHTQEKWQEKVVGNTNHAG